MTTAPIYDMMPKAPGKDLVALNPHQVRYIRSNFDGVRVYFDNDHSIIIPNTDVETLAIDIWGSSRGPLKDTR